MSETIVNRVANSPLITLNLEDFYHPGERVVFDIAPMLFHGMILREKDFREFVAGHDWTQYAGKNVAILCSADAVVPVWAYMLVGIHLEPVANRFVFGDLESLELSLFQDALSRVDVGQYVGKPVVIKGCSDRPVPVSAYVELTRLLRPVAKAIFYGEPCSTVPLYKAGKSAG